MAYSTSPLQQSTITPNFYASVFLPSQGTTVSSTQPLNQLTQRFQQYGDCCRLLSIIHSPLQRGSECSRLIHATGQESGISSLVQEKLKAISIEVSQIVQTQQIDPKETLLQIAELFKANKTDEAFAEFALFEENFPQLAKQVHGNLWALKGSPTNKHPDFGKVAFYNREGFSSLNCEKAEAIEHLYLAVPDRISQIIDLFESGNHKLAFEKFAQLEKIYPKLAEAVFYKVWIAYGKPDQDNLSEIADPNFGRVAFYNIHPKSAFQYQPNIGIAALKELLPSLSRSIHFTPEAHRARRDLRCREVVKENLSVRTGQKEKYADAIQNSKIYRDGGSRDPKPPRFAKTEFSVYPMNCVKIAYDLARDKQNKVYVLNLANSDHAGGAYLRHFGSQEEELFRCTDLPLILDHLSHGVQPQNFYPIHRTTGSFGGVYSPSVPLFRMGLEQDYRISDEDLTISVGTFAAFNRPRLDFTNSANPRLQGDVLSTTEEKLRTSIHAAYVNGDDTLILGAFGCGAFQNPPEHIAELTMSILEKEYKGCFKKIVFAVLKDENNHAHNPEGNYVPFARAVQKVGGTAYDQIGQPISENYVQ
ncbi:MAG: TIGR02452 family protein [Parachlamydiales bacterium]|nr:TIGR02452 family protein [Verrucomicrobiota bacterium]MBX3720003.1 TIGR02452 family protein [Candidatus Acheromyda pituitae]